ncbi:MAG: hypothetical protein ABR600_00170 [Actinomycetota bacterium]
MALWAVGLGVPAAAIAFGLGSLVRPGVGASAAIGVGAVVASFCANALGLGWARTVSLTATQIVALSGFVIRLAFVIGVYAAFKATASWFVPIAFGGGLAAILPLAGYEAYLARRGRIAELIVDADRATAARTKERA